jgi:hypothetical protein
MSSIHNVSGSCPPYASVVTLWLDFAIRWYTKLAKKSELISFEVVADNLAKMVLRRDGPWWGLNKLVEPSYYVPPL